ncbi:3'-5' exonuclease [Clostridium oryzae]|uniref:Exonuclease n=1 Tax=Clostridium oryzae TaxID=1450648 RepID=A0A1V4IBK6_9CLOT|nr:3'-5' exonuclease [Clostridium oryzae]OPJ57309.1 exonuclease [Clostridium oryzae]
MNYIIFDLEFNQEYIGQKDNKNSKFSTQTSKSNLCPFEVIQIGAVKLNKNLDRISEFNEFVKPELYTVMHPYVQEITGITMSMLNSSDNFKVIGKRFLDFISGKENILCSWGNSDIRELRRNIVYHKISKDFSPSKFINIQLMASKYFNYPKGTSIGLKNAVQLLDLPVNEDFHDAFNDACYTEYVFRKIHNSKITINNQ